MKQFLLVASVLLLGSHASEVTPVQKVIQLMNEMMEKGKAEKHAEQVQFAAYKQFCDDTSAEKARAIEDAAERIDVLKADIQQALADGKRLTKEIGQHEEEITLWTGDLKAINAVSQIEKEDYDALHKDYSESIDALNRAIAVLKKQAHDRKQASFAQVSALKSLSLIPAEAKTAIDTFLAQDTEVDDNLAVSAPEANAYEFQSGGIIEMLEKLLDKFIAERTALEKAEMERRHQFELMDQQLTAQKAQAEQDADDKTKQKAKRLDDKANAEAELEDTTASKKEDETYKKDLDATCAQKATDFESRQQLRAEELEAVQKAINIIADSAVKGASEKHLPQFVQKPALAQLRADARSPTQDRAVAYLQMQANQLNSRVLAVLATRVAADPFAKVKKMIKDLIVRLMEEAGEEAEHKGWCDTELAKNEKTRTAKSNAVETLKSEIEELTASNAKLKEEVAQLTTDVADLTTAQAEAVTLREQEKEKNAQTVKDAEVAQAAVAQAITVLKEFYDKAAQATAFVQQHQEPPPIFDKPYKGMGAESGGVVGMLEVIESDFARLQADTEADEATAQKEHDTFMNESEIDKKTKETDIEHKTETRENQENALESKQGDLENTQKELDAALEYYDKLKPSCVVADVSYEDRVARRKEEIESLQEALKILNGEELR